MRSKEKEMDYNRYHLEEPTIEINGQIIGKGWVLITEKEYSNFLKLQKEEI